jgi:hypothetical protein
MPLFTWVSSAYESPIVTYCKEHGLKLDRETSNGPSDVDTYTGGFLYWLGYSGFDFGVVVAGTVLLVMWRSTDRASIAATSLLSVTILAALLAMFGVIGKSRCPLYPQKTCVVQLVMSALCH